MMVSFLGSPCSGKTTTAALVFSYLKDTGIATEFVPEQARFYIAAKKVVGDFVCLTDEDQIAIMKQQYEIELLMQKACHEQSIIISDSSVLNTLLYLSPNTRGTDEVKDLVKKAVANYDVIFYCPPVKPVVENDPNRVHTPEESLAINNTIPKILEEVKAYLPNLFVIPIMGDSKLRHAFVLGAINASRLVC